MNQFYTRHQEESGTPLATTLASSLNSTTCILPIWPESLRVVVAVATSHRNTDLSPPDDANLALSLELGCTEVFDLEREWYEIDKSIHSDGEDFIAVCSKSFDFSAETGIPKADSSVLAASQDVFCRALWIAGDIDRSFMAAESSMNSPCQGLGTTRGSHEGEKQGWEL